MEANMNILILFIDDIYCKFQVIYSFRLLKIIALSCIDNNILNWSTDGEKRN